MEHKTRISGVVMRDNKMLMLKGKGKEFWTPGGKIEKGESDEECLKRELKEEIGVDLIDLKFFREYSHLSYYNPEVVLDVRVYIVTISGKIKPDAEIEDFVWMTKEDFESKKYPIITSIEEQTISYLIKDGIL